MFTELRRAAQSAFQVHALASGEPLHQEYMQLFHPEGPVFNMCIKSRGCRFLSPQK